MVKLIIFFVFIIALGTVVIFNEFRKNKDFKNASQVTTSDIDKNEAENGAKAADNARQAIKDEEMKLLSEAFTATICRKDLLIWHRMSPTHFSEACGKPDSVEEHEEEWPNGPAIIRTIKHGDFEITYIEAKNYPENWWLYKISINEPSVILKNGLKVGDNIAKIMNIYTRLDEKRKFLLNSEDSGIYDDRDENGTGRYRYSEDVLHEEYGYTVEFYLYFDNISNISISIETGI